MPIPLRRILPVGVLVVLVLAGPVVAGSSDSTAAVALLGDPSTVLEAPADSAPIAVRVVVDWSHVESVENRFDWTEVESGIRARSEAGQRTILCLTGSNPSYLPAGELPSPLVEGSVEAWLRFVRAAVRTFAGRVEVFEIWDGPAGLDPDLYGFLLKQSALAVRAEAEAAGVEVRLAQGALDVERLDWQAGLWERDAAAYIDVLPVRFTVDGADEGLETTLKTVFVDVLEHPPAPEVWVYLEPAPGADSWAAFGAAVRALSAGASLAAPRLSGYPPRAAEQGRWAAGLQGLLDQGFAPAPSGGAEVRNAAREPVAGWRVLGRFLDDEFNALLFYQAPGSSGEDLRVTVTGSRVRDVRMIDPLTGASSRTSVTQSDDGGWVIRAAGSDHPQALRFSTAVVTPGFELPTEELEVESTRSLTAGEIIARHQQVQRVQDDLLERWVAKGRIDYHFKFAGGGSTIDVSIDSNYFWERGGDIEWEQAAYYINGNKVGWKRVPELPLIQPEKVVTLPLDLTLDKTYLYRLVGEDRVRGREAYVLEFRPTEPDASRSLYQGRVWIDRESFQRLKVSLVQTRTNTPEVLSNEERDVYLPHPGPGGRDFWLLTEIEGQQVWSAAGRNFVVRREINFSEFEINLPAGEFASRRRAAYASDNQMLRDTEEGFRYLRRQDDGTRLLSQKVDTDQLFVGAGAFREAGAGGDIVPLAGVNYFDYDLFGKNIQFNALLAGAVNFVTATKPDLFERRISGTLEATLVAIRFGDEFFVGADESVFEAVEQRPQNLSVRLGFPLGGFYKLTLVGDATWRDYAQSDDARSGLEMFSGSLEYRVPKDHLEASASLSLEMNRRGYSLVLDGQYASRSDWEEFGLFDPATGQFVRFLGGNPFDPASYAATETPEVRRNFARWGATAFKEWYLRSFQKFRAELNFVSGSNLDRFSQYAFSLFGDDRLSGFAGSGVRFDLGAIGRIGYSFNLLEAIRFDVAVEHARVRDRLTLDQEQSFTGAGVSANFIAPWKTVINLSYGYALQSDIPDLEGRSEFLLLIFKLFR